MTFFLNGLFKIRFGFFSPYNLWSAPPNQLVCRCMPHVARINIKMFYDEREQLVQKG